MTTYQALSDAPAVWIVVLHWVGDEYTRSCLKSLQQLDYSNYQILLVDNGSPTGSGAKIAGEFENVTLLSSKTNLGFAGGCNLGIEYCHKHGAEWIWLINNDTTADEALLSKLMAIALKNPRAGALGAVVYTGADKSASGPGEIDFVRAKTYLRATIPANTETVSCDWLSGCNLLLRCAALQQAGNFDEDYFLYFEDTELCHRLRHHNWQCLLVPAASINHAGSASTQGSRAYWRDYYYTRNRLLFFCRNLSGLRLIPALFSMASHLLRHALVLPFRGKKGRQQLRAEYLGLRDYLLGRLGRATCLQWCDLP